MSTALCYAGQMQEELEVVDERGGNTIWLSLVSSRSTNMPPHGENGVIGS